MNKGYWSASRLQHIDARPRIVGAADCECGWFEPMRILYDHEWVMVSSGSIVVVIDTEEITCPAGYYVIVPPNTAQHSFSEKGCKRHWVHFDWTNQGSTRDMPIAATSPAVPDALQIHGKPEWVPQGVIHGKIRRPAHIMRLHRRLAHLAESDPARFGLIGRPWWTEILLELFADAREEGSHRSTTRESNIVAALRDELRRLAEIPMHQSPPLRDQLAKFGFCYEHAQRLFKKYHGLTPVAYLRTLRLEKAKFLLAKPGLSVTDVSQGAGFSSPGYFSRLFRHHAGRSPLEWRKEFEIST